MDAVRAHYDDLLGPIYAWMVGDMGAAIAAAREDLRAAGIAARGGGAAVDLLRVSRYPKLRLDPQWVCTALGDRGLVARLEPGASGMVRVVAARP